MLASYIDTDILISMVDSAAGKICFTVFALSNLFDRTYIQESRPPISAYLGLH